MVEGSTDTPSKPVRRRVLDQPPEVVRRWVRIKVMGSARNLARALSRWRLPLAEKKRRAALEGAFNEVKKQAIKFEHNRYQASNTIFNIALFFLLAERDIQILKIYALTHRDEWTRKLCARVILLTIHELDLDKVSGQPLREALETIGAPEHLRKEASLALREVRAVQNKARKEFSVLRNATIAHRDPNALLQYRAIRNLKVEAVFSIAGEFYLAAGRFIQLVPRLMLESSTIPALLRQYAQTDEDRTQSNRGD
jgi:hypothetical protein